MKKSNSSGRSSKRKTLGLGVSLLDRIDPEVPPLPPKPTLRQKSDALYKANKLHERIRLYADKAYYCVVVFQSCEQKDHFVKEMGWLDDRGETMWLDGRVIAAKEGIKLPFVDEQLLHAAYSKRKGHIDWPEGLKFFDETTAEGKEVEKR
jgi:hypothetical protein